MALYDIVSNRRKVQSVDLQPYGNTISVEAESDNPFEDAQDVEVFTQTNRGMGDVGPHRGARSRAIITKPTSQHGRMVFAGKARATKTIAPAHVQHAAFIPGLSGLGEAPGGTTQGQAPASSGWNWGAIGQGVTNLATAAGGIVSQQQQAKIAASNAAAADANARIAAAKATQGAAAQIEANMGAHKGISGTLLAVAGLAAVAGIVIFMVRKPKRK